MLNTLWDIKDNLMLLKDGSVFAVYHVPPKVINSPDFKGKENFKETGFSALSNLRQYHDFEIARVPIDQDIIPLFNKIAQDIDWEDGSASLAEYLLNGMVDKLYESLGTIYEYRYYIIAPLKSIHVSVDLKSVVSEGYRTLRNSTLSIFGLGEQVPLDWHKKYENQEKILKGKLDILNVKRVSTEEHLFIQRLQFLRGMIVNKDKEVLLVKNNIENVDEVNIEFEHVNIMKFSNMDETIYQAALPIDRLPENVSYLHLQEEIDRLNFPVESRYKVQFSTPVGVFSLPNKAKRSRRRLKNTMNEAAEADDAQNTQVVRSSFLLEDLKEKVDEDIPLVSYMHTLFVTGETIDILKSKIDILFSVFSEMGISLVRANADQPYLFYKNRYGEVLTKGDKNFIQSMTLEAFCENLFFMTRKVGTDIGFPIGRIDYQTASWRGDYKAAIEASSSPVYVNLLQANKQGIEGKTTNNPHSAVIGETGSGKSYLIKLLFLYHSLLKMQCLYIDPKREVREQYHRILKELERKNSFPELQDYIKSIHYVTLDPKNKQNHGTLDPIVFLEGQEAIDLADSMIDSVLKDNTDEIETAYLTSIEKVLKRRQKGEKVGMLHVFEDMQQSSSKVVADAGYNLWRKSQNSILSLCFSDGQNEAISLTNKITILEISGLDLPKSESKADLTRSQKKSLVVLYGLGYFCKRFGERDRTVETMSVFDECWMFNATPAGREVIMEMKRIGRSYNNFLLLGTQSVHDLESEDDSTGFGTVFAFLEETEIEDVLTYLKLPINDETKSWIGNMTMGQCIFYDTYGRKERITVDGMFPEVTKLFNTVQSSMKATKA
ncbi:ATP-binding protein [Streptococcus sp. zg-JUN1979]|uniref:ATP-binding protein n=1 Tax=Streptococcus sp. zg-JUN1979 TaxID=3391450 RepID=UPI0039A77893